MRSIVNDEIEIPEDLTVNRVPTEFLRFRDVGHGRMLLEQKWESIYQGVKDEWVPVPFVETE